MGTKAEPVDLSRLQAALSAVRADTGDVYRKSWVIVGHVDNNPLLVDVLSQDTSSTATLQDMCRELKDDQVMYCLLRLTTTFDMSTTVKFIYVHWVGEKVPFAKKGRFGVVSGSVEEHFSPFHLELETSTTDDLQEDVIMQKLEETSGTRSKIVEGTMAGRQERGFTASSAAKRHDNVKSELRSIAPAGVVVSASPEVAAAIAEVRDDVTPTNWVGVGYSDDGDIRKPLYVVAKGTGDVEQLKGHFDDAQAMYALYRTTDTYDDIRTVKFVYIYWMGEKVKPLTKGKLSAYAGPVEQLFSPSHVTMSFSQRSDIRESIIKDKVQASSGSKLFVK
jgi:hypothetical protein